MAKKQEGTSWGDGYVYYLDCDAFINVYLYQDSLRFLKSRLYINNLHT